MDAYHTKKEKNDGLTAIIGGDEEIKRRNKFLHDMDVSDYIEYKKEKPKHWDSYLTVNLINGQLLYASPYEYALHYYIHRHPVLSKLLMPPCTTSYYEIFHETF